MSTTGTTAVPTEIVPQGPLCPGCVGGRLQAYVVTIDLSDTAATAVYGYGGAAGLTGWVAVCHGDRDKLLAPCGFSLPMTPEPPLGRTFHSGGVVR